jgi:DNA excision repair protein ERCC-5
MDAPGEENEFARFVAEVKGRDLRQVQAEIDDEIRVLYAQKRAALRDAEDVQGTTVAQIMTLLRLFGVPYMTAPMEAEAQCAALGALGLVDGVITDDSDVFLFGGARVFKNMFNQSRTVECFLARDLERELGLTRDTLVRLACLLGSDYIDGLPGVGPVVAMELLREFPGEDGLHKFRDWWTRVQMARDRPEESKSSFRKRFVSGLSVTRRRC